MFNLSLAVLFTIKSKLYKQFVNKKASTIRLTKKNKFAAKENI